MELVALLICIGVGYAVRSALENARTSARTSRGARLKQAGRTRGAPVKGGRKALAVTRHDVGWWGGEALRGFPHLRHGLAQGWHDHARARDEAYADRQDAAATRAERRREVLERVRTSRERQRRAREAANAPEAPAKPDLRLLPGGAPDGAPGAVPPLPAGNRAHPDQEPAPDLPASAPLKPPEPDDDGTGWVPVSPTGQGASRFPGASGLPDDYLYVPCPDCGAPVGERCKPGCDYDPGQTSPATTGEPVTTKTETTYTQDIAEANAIVSEAEQHLADLKKRRWADRMEALAGANLDPGTLSNAADLGDSINGQIKAAEQTVEHATSFRDNLQRTHSAGHEYHSSTPQGGAERAYLQE